jgi:hypothetical protein
MTLGEIFDDRERVPHDDIVVVQTRYASVGRELAELCANVACRQGHEALLEGDA